jgi:hypothetical protein
MSRDSGKQRGSRRWPMKAGRFGAMVVLAMLAVACSDDGDVQPPPAPPATPAPPAPPAPSSVSATIGSAGGTLDGPDGVQVIVPPGALDANTTLTVARTSAGAPALADELGSGTVYEFTPHGQMFLRPVEIRMPFSAPSDAAFADVVMAGPGEPWLATRAEIAAGTARIHRDSFSWGVNGVCRIPANNQDAYVCTQASIQITNVTSSVDGAQQPGCVGCPRQLDIAQGTTLTIAYSYQAPLNCQVDGTGGARVELWRSTNLAFRSGTRLAERIVPLPGTTPNSALGRGTGTFDVTLSNADNGRFVLQATIQCLRPRPSGSALTLSDSDYRVLSVAIPGSPAPTAPAISGLTPTPANATIAPCSSFSVVAAASGSAPLAYQWRRNGTALTDGPTGETCNGQPAQVSGAGGTTLTLSNVPATYDGSVFDVVVSNVAGSATSNGVTLKVEAPPALAGVFGATTALASFTYTGGQQGLFAQQRAACGRDGSCMVLWTRFSSVPLGADGIYAARLTAGGNWEAVAQLSSRGQSPALGMDAAGNAIAIWEARDAADGDRFKVFAARFTPAGGWAAPVVISTTPLLDGAGVSGLAVSANGTAVALIGQFLNDAQTTRGVYAARFDGSAWSAPVKLNAQREYGRGDVVIDDQGRATVIFEDSDGLLYEATSSGGAWTPQARLETSAIEADGRRLAVDADGRVWLAWEAFNASKEYVLQLRHRAAAGAWSTVESVTASTDGADALFAAGPGGRLLASYNAPDPAAPSAPYAVWSREYIVGTGWTAAARASPAASSDPRIRLLAYDRSGSAVVVWDDVLTCCSGRLTGNTFNTVAGWSVARVLQAYDERLDSVAAALSGAGTGAIVWSRPLSGFSGQAVYGVSVR